MKIPRRPIDEISEEWEAFENQAADLFKNLRKVFGKLK